MMPSLSSRQTTEVDGGYEFECQHGADECYGNIVQACTLAHTEDRDTQVALIVCMMSSPNPSTAGPDCFQQMSLDYQPILVSENKIILSQLRPPYIELHPLN